MSDLFNSPDDTDLIASLSGDHVPGLAQPASTANVGSSTPPSTSSPLGTISDDLASIVNTLKGANQVKGQSQDALAELEKLIGIGGAPAPQAPASSGSMLTVIAVAALVVLGGVIAWKLYKRGG